MTFVMDFVSCLIVGIAIGFYIGVLFRASKK